MSDTLQVSEIFRSVQSETSYVGLPCAFVRLAGCNLNCHWCDTRYAADEPGQELSVDTIAHRLDELDTVVVCVTGGEPLLQAPVIPLMWHLIHMDHIVMLETNGSRDLAAVPPDVVRVVDVKCPASGECGSTLMSNLKLLQSHDEVKFVVQDRRDFMWAAEFVRRHGLLSRCHVLFSPVLPPREPKLGLSPKDILSPSQLAEWILESGLEVRMQIQLHKLLWPDRERGV